MRQTTVAAETDLELASIGERAGALLAFAATTAPIEPVVDDSSDEPPWLDSMLALRAWRTYR